MTARRAVPEGSRLFADGELARRAADGLHLAGYRVVSRAPTKRRPEWLVEWYPAERRRP